MKKILYLLCSCFAVTLMASCEDFLDKTPQGDKTDQDIFSRFNETESLINRLYFYARAADQPLVHIRFFSDSALTDECEGSSARERYSQTSSTTATGNRVPSSTPRATPRQLLRRLPHLLAQTLRRHPLRQRHPRRYREVQHPGFRGTPRHAFAAYRRGALHPRLPALLRAEKLRRMPLRRLLR